jgi:CRP-like cAMP-binding protein
MDLLDYFRSRLRLTDPICEELDRLFVRKNYAKGHQLLEINNISRKVIFMEAGLGRTYYYKDGKEITHLFFAEDSFNAAIDSIYHSKPSPYAFEFLEDSVVRSANYDLFQEFMDKNHQVQRLITLILIDMCILFSDRLYSMQFQSAAQRYKSLIERHPNILLRAPLGTIASYLGITQQTLSVIRAEKY